MMARCLNEQWQMAEEEWGGTLPSLGCSPRGGLERDVTSSQTTLIRNIKIDTESDSGLNK